MPSPLGHALTGFAVGWLVSPPGCRRVLAPTPGAGGTRAALSRWRWPLAFGLAGMAADLDLLAGAHSRYTHSIGAVLLVVAGAWLARRRSHDAVAAALALGMSYASHLFLDWLATDTSPPIGIMVLWPFSSAFYVSPVTVFMGISRKYWLANAWMQNARSITWELLVVLPLTGLAVLARRPRKN